jgi:hypothetical protein
MKSLFFYIVFFMSAYTLPAQTRSTAKTKDSIIIVLKKTPTPDWDSTFKPKPKPVPSIPAPELHTKNDFEPKMSKPKNDKHVYILKQ